MEKRIEKIEETITKIQENHLSHLEADSAKNTANLEWLMKYHWIVATASVSALVVGIVNLLKH